jgi:hypothetical protein
MNTLAILIKSLTKKEREEFEAAKQRGYLIDRSRTREDLEIAYRNWCDITATPFIAIRRGYVVFWFLSGSASLSDQGREEMHALWHEYSFLDDEEANNWICANSGDFVGILPKDREPLARDIFLAVRKQGALDTSMRNIDPLLAPDYCVPLPFEYSISAWVKDQAIPRRWSELTGSHRRQ